MTESLPIIIIALAAVLGAAYMVRSFQGSGRFAGIGALAGAGAGGIGSLIFMAPLNFCTFETERTALDVAFGIVLIGVGMLIALIPVRWLIRSRMQNAPSPFSD